MVLGGIEHDRKMYIYEGRTLLVVIVIDELKACLLCCKNRPTMHSEIKISETHQHR
jgi:hypothetical protein